MLRILVQFPLGIIRLIFAPLSLLRRYLLLRKRPWVHLRLQDKLTLVNRPAHRLERWLPRSPRRGSQLLAIDRVADHLARRRLPGLVITVPRMKAGWAAIERLASRLIWLSEQGVEIAVFYPDGAGPKELVISAAASRVALGKGASISYYGIAAEKQYLGAALERLGLRLQVWRRGAYKSAMEGFRSTEMSDAERTQLDALVQAMDAEVMAGLQRCTPEARDRLAAEGSLYDEHAVSAGLVDTVIHADEVSEWVAGPKASLLGAGAFLRATAPRRLFRLRRAPYIAVIPISGAIAHPRGGGPENGPRSWLEKARKDKRALGAVLLIDSPGGSALASEQIHREVERLNEEKPVVAMLQNVAASGGYYIAAAADSIVASRSTITGSIGVIGAKLVASKLFEHLSVHSDRVMTREGADLFSPHRAMTDEESARIDRSLGATYQRFLEVVSKGRGLSLEEVDAVAQGRVWAGRDAVERGLVDNIGGRDEVLKALSARLSKTKNLERLEWVVTAPPKAPGITALASGGAELERLGGLQLQCLLQLASSGAPWMLSVDIPRVD